VSYSLRIKGSARKDLERIHPPDRERLLEAIDRLRENPHQGSLLKGEMLGLRRVRVGSYRIIYEVQERALLVLVIRVGHRRDVYR